MLNRRKYDVYIQHHVWNGSIITHLIGRTATNGQLYLFTFNAFLSFFSPPFSSKILVHYKYSRERALLSFVCWREKVSLFFFFLWFPLSNNDVYRCPHAMTRTGKLLRQRNFACTTVFRTLTRRSATATFIDGTQINWTSISPLDGREHIFFPVVRF